MIRISTLNSGQHTQLELFLKSKLNQSGKISVRDSMGNTQTAEAGTGYYRWIKIPLKENLNYDIKIEEADVSIAYLSGNENIMEEGICFLAFEQGVQKIQGSKLSEFYDTPYLEQYHFIPFKNWINDPNGLCWYKGKYHLFYQANPHEQQWGDMYWGHAVSSDLIHWRHLPYVFEPQQEVLENPSIKGGAFSGSAVPLEDKVIFYLTRHMGPLEDCEKTLEWQTMTSSTDMLQFKKEQTVIREKPEGVGYDFRDPKVFKVKDKWYLVLAANYKGDSAILLYSSNDMYTWTYENPLLIEPDKRATNFECPDCFELDGKYVVVGALMRHVDEYKRFQMTKYYIGDFENQKLKVESTGWYDFGSNFYAVQSFEHNGRRISIGWISDFYQEHIKVKGGAYGSMSIPRELHIKDGKLYIAPIREVYSLRDRLICSEANHNISINYIHKNSYYTKIIFSGETDFNICIAKTEHASLSLIRNSGVTELKTIGVNSENVRFIADVIKVTSIEIFMDWRVAEVFLNDGEAAGSKIFYCDNTYGSFEAKFEHPDLVSKIDVYTMNSIW